MKGFSRTEIIGNVGAENAKLGETTGGTPVCEFSVAVNETYLATDGSAKDTTQWYRVSIYGKRAKSLAPHIKSGMSVFAAGRVQAEAWVTGEGTAKAALKLVLGESGKNDFLFLSSSNGGTAAAMATGSDKKKSPHAFPADVSEALEAELFQDKPL